MKTFKWTIPEAKHEEFETPLKNLTSWSCPKCKNNEFEVSEFHATGSKLAKYLNIQSTKFSTITCTKCSYTEIYKCAKDKLGNILDLFVG